MMELSNTAYVVLGAVAERPRSGYDIKRFADKAIRLFWAVGFAQLYPELKGLSESGLIEPSDASVGARRRTEYRITDLGREALADWVAEPGTAPQEVRDEMIVRIFFSDVVEPATRADLARKVAERHRDSRAALIDEAETKLARMPCPELPMHEAVQRFGVDYHTFMEQWFGQLAERLAGTDEEHER